MSDSLLYLDTSALVKLIRVGEVWGKDLRAYLAAQPAPIISSALARTELLRATFGEAAEVERAEEILDDIELVAITSPILDRAGRLAPGTLRSLDAVHTATAEQLGDDIRAFITYDDRMILAARGAGIEVEAPGKEGPTFPEDDPIASDEAGLSTAD